VSRQDESILNLLVRLPWWVSIAAAFASYIVLEWLFPIIKVDHFFMKGVMNAFHSLAPVVAFILLMTACLSAISRKKKKALFHRQKDIKTVNALNWRQFESLVGEAFRQRGYSVLDNPSDGPDGGVDLRVCKNGKHYYVQCKHWNERNVGVKVIREMVGALSASNADGAFVVTNGDFTQEAIEAASEQPIRLVNGRQLMAMMGKIESLQKLKIQPMLSRNARFVVIRWFGEQRPKRSTSGNNFGVVPNFPPARGLFPSKRNRGDPTPTASMLLEKRKIPVFLLRGIKKDLKEKSKAASKQPIRIVNGRQLLEMIGDVESQQNHEPKIQPSLISRYSSFHTFGFQV